MCARVKKYFGHMHYPELFFLVIIIVIGLLSYRLNADINTLLISAAGAFIGAGAAFFLNTFQSSKKIRLKNIASLKEASYIIKKISLSAEQLKGHLDKPIKDNGYVCAWEKIGRYNRKNFIPSIPVQDLLFLVEDNEKTLDSVLLVDAENQAMLSVLETRNQQYITYLEKTPKSITYRTQEELVNIIGQRLYQELEELTSQLIKLNKNLIEDCEAATKKINIFLKNY